ncbi:hypothetical protein [Geodermatophilus sp. URMC 64]
MVAVSITLALTLLSAGAAAGVLAIAAAAGLGWLLWRFGPALRTADRGIGPRGVGTAPWRDRSQHRRRKKQQGRPRPSGRIAEAE